MTRPAPPTGSAIALFAIALAVYANALPNGFVVDDLHQIVENSFFRQAVSLDPRFTEARLNLGVAWAVLRDRPCVAVEVEALRMLDAEAWARLQSIAAEADARDRAARHDH